MLKGIDPLLDGELLRTLDQMGHGDQLVVVDSNYPAAATGRPVHRLGRVGVDEAIATILGVFPLDSFITHPLERMEVEEDPNLTTPAHDAVLATARSTHPSDLEWGVIPRLEFYRRARDAYAVVHTLDPRPWGCMILHKGVIVGD